MADKRVFVFEVDGVETSITEFSTLADVLDVVTNEFNSLDTEATASGDALKEVGNDAKKAGKELGEAGKKGKAGLEDLNVELIDSNERLQALQGLTDGIAGAFGGATATFVSFAGESPRLEKLNERVGALAQTLGGVVALTSALQKENRAAIGQLIGNFGKAAKAAKAFAFSARGALAATGIGLFVVAVGAIADNFDSIKSKASSTFSSVKENILSAFPPLKVLIDGVQSFADTVGGFRQLFAGAFEAAKTFFTSLGSAFVALLKGDLGKVKDIFKDFGKEATESFNEGVKESNEQINEERLRSQLANEIKINERLIAERKAAGLQTFELEKANLRRQIKLAEEGSEERLDLQSELNALILARRKELADASLSIDKEASDAEKEQAIKDAEEEVARLEEEAAIKADIDTRNKEASFERSQLLREAELAALEESEEATLLILEESANLRLELAQNERDKALEDESLTEEERLLIIEQFNFAEAELERQRLAEIQAFEDSQVEAKKKAEDEKAKVDEVAKKDELARDQALKNAQASLNDQRIQNARATVQFLGEVAKEGSTLQKVAFAVDKGLAIAEILINLQKELSAIAASNAGLGPAGPFVIAGLQAAAGVRAALGVGTVASTFIKAEKGGLLTGPSHKKGGIKGRGSFGNIEVEGGEFIVNKRATARNLPALKKMNSLKFQDGGLLPDFNTINEGIAPIEGFNEELLDEVRAINSAPVVVSVVEINKVNDRVTDITESASL